MAEVCRLAGHLIVQVFSRTIDNAEALATKTGAMAVTSLKQITPDADLYIFSVKDDVLSAVIQQMPPTRGIWAHTSGSLSMELFAGYVSDFGVIYPLQTFSKQRQINFAAIPIFIEGNNPDTICQLEELANSLSRNVRVLSGDKRRQLHLAAVFACNFVNHLYVLAAEIIDQEDLPFDLLLPLIAETAAKVEMMTPREAQTGPALRYDETVMQKHLSLLADAQMKELYTLLSTSIHQHTI